MIGSCEDWVSDFFLEGRDPGKKIGGDGSNHGFSFQV